MKNRIIKFRVWTGKKMCDDFVLDWRQGFIKIGGGYETFAPTSPNSKHKVMQFTGLTDKNGKEIYEGDIVRNPMIGDLWKVIFTEGAFQYSLLGKHEVIELAGFMSEPWEVIGNIYSNLAPYKEI